VTYYGRDPPALSRRETRSDQRCRFCAPGPSCTRCTPPPAVSARCLAHARDGVGWTQSRGAHTGKRQPRIACCCSRRRRTGNCGLLPRARSDGAIARRGCSSRTDATRARRWTRDAVAVVKKAANDLGLFKGTSPQRLPAFPRAAAITRRHGPGGAAGVSGARRHQHTRRIYAPYTAAEKVRDQLETFGRSARDAAQDAAAKMTDEGMTR